VPLDDDSSQLAFGDRRRTLEDDAPDAMGGNEVVNQNDSVRPQRSIDLNVLIQAEAE
jgi:hypothetical protein